MNLICVLLIFFLYFISFFLYKKLNYIELLLLISITLFMFVLVKYLREVTPYFRKATIISEVGWELQRGFLSSNPPIHRSPQKADTRYLPLQLCCLTRNYKHPDPGTHLLQFFFPCL